MESQPIGLVRRSTCMKASQAATALLKPGLVVLIVGSVVVIGGLANASCHSFRFGEVKPTSVRECCAGHAGPSVQVEVIRDGAAAPSSVRVTTIEETAVGFTKQEMTPDWDYTSVDERVNFVGDATSSRQSEDPKDHIEIVISDDQEIESPETFRLHLSDPEGCTVLSEFELGPDVRVTIEDNDQYLITPSPIAPQASRASETGPSPPPSESPSPTPSPSPSALSPSAHRTDEGNGLPVGAVIALVAGALGLSSAGGWLLYRRRAA